MNDFQKRAVEIFTHLSWDQRAEVFDELCEHYCWHCWMEHPEDGLTCQCANDE